MYRISTFPKSWYLVGRSEDFTTDKPTSIDLHKKKFVVYRKSDGSLAAVSSRCTHMGSNLAHGCIKNDNLVCPFHAWQYNSDGQCVHIPAAPEEKNINRRLESYAIAEQQGLVFVFNDREAHYPLPFFKELADQALVSGSTISLDIDAAWYLVAGNAFDIPHFAHVHNRIAKCPPRVDETSEHSRYIEHTYEICPKSTWIDRLIRKIMGTTAKLKFTVFSGNFILAVTEFGSLSNYMMINVKATDTRKSISQVTIFKPTNPRNPFDRWFKKALLKVQTFFTRRFFEAEAREVVGLHLNRNNLHKTDHILAGYLDWVEGMGAAQ